MVERRRRGQSDLDKQPAEALRGSTALAEWTPSLLERTSGGHLTGPRQAEGRRDMVAHDLDCQGALLARRGGKQAFARALRLVGLVAGAAAGKLQPSLLAVAERGTPLDVDAVDPSLGEAGRDAFGTRVPAPHAAEDDAHADGVGCLAHPERQHGVRTDLDENPVPCREHRSRRLLELDNLPQRSRPVGGVENSRVEPIAGERGG